MKSTVLIVLAILFFLALAGIGAALYFYNLKPKDLNKAKPDYVLTSSDLQKYFEENENEATVKYVDKIIEVSGEIGSVKPGESNSLNISLKTGNIYSFIICTFSPASDSDPGIYKIGSQISIRGVCSGYLTDVLLNNCTVPKASK